MRLTFLLKPALLLFELLRIVIIANILIALANNASFFMMMVFAVQGVLFPLMALFLCLNAVRYREFLPLYIAGKIIGITAILSWSLFTQQATIIEGHIGGQFGGHIREVTLICFDLFAVTALLIIKKNVKKLMSEAALAAAKLTAQAEDQAMTKKRKNFRRRKINAYNSNSKRKGRSGKISCGCESCSSVRPGRQKRRTRRS